MNYPKVYRKAITRAHKGDIDDSNQRHQTVNDILDAVGRGASDF